MSRRESGTRPRVLIVDDDPLMRRLARATLEQAEFEVDEAVDGEQAMAMFQTSEPSLVLLDVEMPGIDGFEVCRRIRRTADAARLPIVMVTGMDDLESINRAYESGATDFISKPISWPILGHRARYVLRGAHAVRDLRAAEKRNSAMLRAIPDMMFSLDSAGTFLDFQAAPGVAPYIAPSSFLGRAVGEVLPPAVAEVLLKALSQAVISGETQSAHYSLLEPAGERHYEARLAPAGPNEILALVRDITAQKQSEEKIRHLAYFDSLTGLPNRQAFLERLDHELQRTRHEGGKLAVIFLDLDGFKRINDTLGHNAGDYLLQSVAERLKDELREGDIVSRPADPVNPPDFARLGGDEFTVIVPNIHDLRVIAHVADRIRNLVTRPFVVHGQEIVVTPSLGIALFPDDGADAAALLKHADTAMYHAKDAGRNNWQMYSASLTTRARARLEIENDLRRALEREEFCLHYQPQIRTVDRRIASAEALVRWNHPQRGLVAPMEFIPVAEECGLIVQIGEWVLRQACMQSRAWRDAGLGAIRIAVNFSGRQLRDPDFLGTVFRAIEDAGIDGGLLELELTESILMDSADANVARMRSLREAGIHFSIDDFGTGYSSMSYLKRFPIGMLKVDQSFVRGLPASTDDAAITTAIIAMAHSLRLDVIAEGVETREQADFLVRAGCEKLQGYLFGRPLPAQGMEPLLHAQIAEECLLPGVDAI